jgi:hypothetical protein
MAADRFVTCIRCAYVMPWIQHVHLRFSMPCPACGTEDQFGPGVYIEDFQGYTWAEVLTQKADKTGEIK